jgi:succinoglycan biosynthesis protein ExoA
LTAPVLPFISIILPVRNEERFIASTLTQLASQNYPRSRFELLVIDGLSADKTVACVQAVAEAHPDLQLSVISNSKMLSSAARNLGVTAARGDYVLIVDGHVDIPTRSLLADAASIINTHGAEILGRPQRLSAQGLSPLQELIAATRGSRIGHSQDSHIYSLNEGWAPPSSIAVMYKKSLFTRFGGFDESFDAAEDLEFNTRLERAGLQCYTSPALEVLYFPRDSYAGLARQMRRYGIGRMRLWLKNRELPSPAAAAPALMVAGGVALMLCGAFYGLAWVALTGCSLAYGLLVHQVYRQDRELKRFEFASVLITMLAIHGALGLGSWEGLFKCIRSGRILPSVRAPR